MVCLRTFVVCLFMVGAPKVSGMKGKLAGVNKLTEFTTPVGFNHDVEYAQNLVSMLTSLSHAYLTCVLVVAYDDYHAYDDVFMTTTLSGLTTRLARPLRQGHVRGHLGPLLVPRHNECLDFLVFLRDVDVLSEVMSPVRSQARTILVTRSTRWQVQEYLSGRESARFPNLVVIIGQPPRKEDGKSEERTVLYGHDLTGDALGEARFRVLGSWRNTTGLSRKGPLFHDQFRGGLEGRRLILAAAHQPPYVINRRGLESREGYKTTEWEGVEIRLVRLIAEKLNFTFEIREPKDMTGSAADIVLKDLREGRADLAAGAIYWTKERNSEFTLIYPHSQDCAAFITLTSIALPKYRAVMGPFLVDVWLALTLTYLLAMVPIAFSVWHSVRPILDDPAELENMFWYVFGTFTNCFTFTGRNSWTRSGNVATRMFIGCYWVFTIIMTAAYTGSIIAFITLPVFPSVVDTAGQLSEDNYRVITIDSGGWSRLLNESSDPEARALYRADPEAVVQDVSAGLSKMTSGSILQRKYALLAPKDLLEYTVRTQFPTRFTGKRSLFHVGRECFVPLYLGLALLAGSQYEEHFNAAVARALQSGFLENIKKDVQWRVYRSSQGRLLKQTTKPLQKMVPEDRRLTLDDVQGTFLVLGAGFAIAWAALIAEIIFDKRSKEYTVRKELKTYWTVGYRKLKTFFLSPIRKPQGESARFEKHDFRSYFGSPVGPELWNELRKMERVMELRTQSENCISDCTFLKNSGQRRSI